MCFETKVLETPNWQGNAVINYTSSELSYTRIIEHKHFESFGEDVYKNPWTVISKEFSTEWKEEMEPFYPVNDAKNQEIFEKYNQLTKAESNVIFGGCLAEYKYYDMAPIVSQVIKHFK